MASGRYAEAALGVFAEAASQLRRRGREVEARAMEQSSQWFMDWQGPTDGAGADRVGREITVEHVEAFRRGVEVMRELGFPDEVRVLDGFSVAYTQVLATEAARRLMTEVLVSLGTEF